MHDTKNDRSSPEAYLFMIVFCVLCLGAVLGVL